MLVYEELKTHSRYSLCKLDVLSLHRFKHDVTRPSTALPITLAFSHRVRFKHPRWQETAHATGSVRLVAAIQRNGRPPERS